MQASSASLAARSFALPAGLHARALSRPRPIVFHAADTEVYAQGEEAYPALVVHGPMQATFLAAMAQRELGGALATFDFRGQSPAFAGTVLHVCGEKSEAGARLWTEQGGAKCMVATISC